MSTEILPIVDSAGNTIGKAPRQESHGGTFLLHPVVHLHVVSSDNKLLLQLRSANKQIQPSKWDTAVGGHVAYGEDIHTALLRETSEELGISEAYIKQSIFVTKYLFRSKIEAELVYVYLLRYDGPFEYQQEEIDNIGFFTQNQIDQLIGSGNLTPNFEQEYQKLSDKLFTSH